MKTDASLLRIHVSKLITTQQNQRIKIRKLIQTPHLFYLYRHCTRTLHVPRQWYAHAVYITPRGNHVGGVVTKFGRVTSCTNPEGKLKTVMTKRHVAVRIITHKLVTNFLSSQTRQSFFMNNRPGCCNKCTCM